jgi:hypothetical protein
VPNVIIPFQHQAVPVLRVDKGIERAAEQAGQDPRIAARRKMHNQDFDRELDSPGHHDPMVKLLEQRAMIQAAEDNSAAWVEQNLELWERNCELSKAQRWEGQERWEGKENERMRMVNVMHPHKIIRKLQAAGIDARLEEHRNARIWLNDWSRSGLVGVNAWVLPQDMDDEGYLENLRHATTQAQKDLLTANWQAARSSRKVQKTITSLQYPYGPEWSVMRFNDHGVPTKEKYRGWRTALLALIIGGVLTEEEVDRAFGPPIGPAGEFYRQQVKAWRQIRIGRPI